MTWRKLIPLLTVLYFTIYTPALAQQDPIRPVVQRCHTTEYLNELMRRDPGLRARMQADEERLNTITVQRIQERRMNKGNQRLDATVTIPVVVHIILPNPNMVTDADVQWQINKMNEDFAGKNADSVNAGPFAALFGHSKIQFCLAQQDEKGNPTSAIERTTSTTTFTRNNPEVLKNTGTCGAKSWDVSRYFNIWVGTATDGTLGIATFPNSGIDEYQGIAISVNGFGNNPAYVSQNFNLGRTAVHEAGHFFYARHIWGDGSCASDFPSISGLPAFTDDTPPQSNSTSGCPTGNMASGCSGAPNPPGRMYQNYMDYTNDACYCMFTLNQVARMEAALEIFRNSLLHSNACSAPAPVALDVALASIVTPASEESCSSSGNNIICSPTFTPQVIIKNYGTTTLTSATVNVVVDNLAAITTNWTGSLTQFNSANISLNAVTTTGGTHTLKVYVSSPNGGADGRPLNDTLGTSFTIVVPTVIPDSLAEGFESAAFPPGDWKVINPDLGSITWERTTAASKSGNASAVMHFYEYIEEGEQDFIISPLIDVSASDSLILTFDRAYKVYSNSATFADSLAVVISTDCGNTFKEVWKRGGSGLATIGGTQNSTEYIPAAADWRTVRLNLKQYYGNADKVIVGFKAVNNFGQNLYLDDIGLEVFRFQGNDASITSIENPFERLCDRTFVPSVTLTNKGMDTIKSARIVFLVDNTPVDSVEFTGELTTGKSAVVQGSKNITIPNGQQHSFTAYSKLPNGKTDDNTGSDTLTVQLSIIDTKPAPVQESFVQVLFPPAGWSIATSGNAYTWERGPSVAEPNGYAWIRNYRFNSNGQKDDLYSPAVQIGEFDSLYIKFDVAHVKKNSSINNIPYDTLEVLITTDCGKTFTSVYKKWGTVLQTVTNTPVYTDTIGFIPADASQWRKEQIDITGLIPANSKFQVVFRNSSNRGNNTFLDNINITGVTLPARLRADGYIIMPNPFNSSFIVRHVTAPVGLKAIEVYNATGQVVYLQQFRGTANTYQYINLGHLSKGVYVVKLIYDSNVVTQRVVKL